MIRSWLGTDASYHLYLPRQRPLAVWLAAVQARRPLLVPMGTGHLVSVLHRPRCVISMRRQCASLMSSTRLLHCRCYSRKRSGSHIQALVQAKWPRRAARVQGEFQTCLDTCQLVAELVNTQLVLAQIGMIIFPIGLLIFVRHRQQAWLRWLTIGLDSSSSYTLDGSSDRHVPSSPRPDAPLQQHPDVPHRRILPLFGSCSCWSHSCELGTARTGH